MCQKRSKSSHGQDSAPQIDLDMRFQVVDTVYVFDKPRIDHAGIYDEKIDPAKPRPRLLRGMDHLVVTGDLARQDKRLRSMRLRFRRRRFKRAGLPRQQRERVSVAREPPGHRKPQPRRSAGDYRYAALRHTSFLRPERHNLQLRKWQVKTTTFPKKRLPLSSAPDYLLHRFKPADTRFALFPELPMPDCPIKTTVVGSYPIPAWLAAYPSRPHLRDAVMVVLKTQELAGLDVIADGELSRFDIGHPETNGMIEYFIRPMEGISTQVSREELAAFRSQAGMSFRSQPAGIVHGKIGEGTLNLPAAWEFIKPLTTHPLKFTVTAPYMLARTLVDHHYGDLRALTMDLAETLRKQVAAIDAPVLQVDEANLTGHPEDAGWAHEPINRVLNAASGEKGLHLCFGNYGGQSIQRGLWKDLLPFLNRLDVNHLILEFARRGYDELEIFKDLRDDIALGVGVIDIKDNEVETPAEVAGRIDRAVGVLGAKRIRWVHPDCGFWMLPRSVADRKMTALVAGRDLAVRGGG